MKLSLRMFELLVFGMLVSTSLVGSGREGNRITLAQSDSAVRNQICHFCMLCYYHGCLMERQFINREGELCIAAAGSVVQCGGRE